MNVNHIERIKHLCTQVITGPTSIKMMLLSSAWIFASGVLLTFLTSWFGKQGANYSLGFGMAAASVLFGLWVSFVNVLVVLSRPNVLRLVPHMKSDLVPAFCIAWLFATLVGAANFAEPIVSCVVIILIAASRMQTAPLVFKKYTGLLAIVVIACILFSVLLRGLADSNLNAPETLAQNSSMLMRYVLFSACAVGLVSITLVTPLPSAAVWLPLIVWLGALMQSGFEKAENPHMVFNAMHVDFAPYNGLMAVFAIGSLAWTLVAIKKKTLTSARRALQINNPKIKPVNNLGLSVSRYFARSWFYAALLNRALRHKASPSQLLGFQFGPGAHWSSGLLLALCFLSFVLLPALLSSSASRASYASVWGMLYDSVPSSLNMLLIFAVAAFHSSIYAAEREQKLMTLAPKALAPHSQNRWLVRTISHYVLSMTILVSIIMLLGLIAMLSDDYPYFRAAPALSFAFSMLIFGGCLMRDYSKAEESHGYKELLLAFVAILGTPIVATMSRRLGLDHPEFSLLIETAIALVAVMFVGFRAYRLLRAPSVFPAGRLSA